MTEQFTAEQIRVLQGLANGILSGMGGTSPSTASGPSAGGEASDAECRGPHGDPAVRKLPKRWAGEDFTGRSYSETSAEFLDCIAESNEYFARLDSAKPDPPKHKNGTPWHVYNSKDARLARGWARMLRAGYSPPTSRSTGGSPSRSNAAPPPPSDVVEGTFDGEDNPDDIPFMVSELTRRSMRA